MGQATRWRPAVRVAWAGTLVAALGLALVGCGSGASAKGATGYPTVPVPPTPTATATPRPTATPSGAVWTRVSASSAAASAMPASLRVIYQVTYGQSDKGVAPQFSLRRSDNFGQTWVNLAPPSIASLDYANDVTYARTSISPLNPQVAILTLQANNGSGGCPLPSASAISGACQAQYVTQDGGAKWAQLRLPAPGMLGLVNFFSNITDNNLSAQGARLYGVVNDVMLASGGGNIPPGRLVASDDGGATWKVVDAALAARNLFIYTYAASPTGSAILALAGGSNQELPPGQAPTLSLWRSLDGGASWTQISPPGPDISGLLAASDSSGAVIFFVYAGASFDAQTLYASHAGNQPWTSWSSQPQDARSAPGLLAALPNGGVLLDATSGVEEWGGTTSAPRAVAWPIGLLDGPTVALQAQADGSTRVWLSGRDMQGAVVEYATLRL